MRVKRTGRREGPASALAAVNETSIKYVRPTRGSSRNSCVPNLQQAMALGPDILSYQLQLYLLIPSIGPAFRPTFLSPIIY